MLRTLGKLTSNGNKISWLELHRNTKQAIKDKYRDAPFNAFRPQISGPTNVLTSEINWIHPTQLKNTLWARATDLKLIRPNGMGSMGINTSTEKRMEIKGPQQIQLNTASILSVVTLDAFNAMHIYSDKTRRPAGAYTFEDILSEPQSLKSLLDDGYQAFLIASKNDEWLRPKKSSENQPYDRWIIDVMEGLYEMDNPVLSIIRLND